MDRARLSNRAIEMNLTDIPTRNNPIGVNAADERGCAEAPAAFMKAAAGTTGPRTVDIPSTPERPWRAVRAK